MIVPMKKYAFLVFHRDIDGFLDQLQSLGVVDISRNNKELAKEEREQLDLMARYVDAIRGLKARKVADKASGSIPNVAAEKVLKEYEELSEKHEQTEAHLKTVATELREMAIWSDFEPSSLERIKKLGYEPRFYTTSRKQFSDEWTKEYAIYLLEEDRNTVYFVLLTRGDEHVNVEAREIKPPVTSLQDKEEEHARLERKHTEQERRLAELTAYIPILEEAKLSLADKLSHTSAKYSADEHVDGKLMVLTGWIPESQSADLQKFLDEQNVLYVEQEVEQEDNVPIKLKNNFFARLFEPITNMYSLPNYREIDVTAFFAPFYMLFFGFCLGDAGYGLLLLLIATLVKPKLKPSQKPYASLLQWLGIAALIFGSFTGSIFGISLAESSWVSKSINEWYAKTSSHNMLMILSIALGAVQVFLGMGIDAYKIAKQQGLKYAISKICWLVGLLTAAVSFGLPYMGVAIPQLVVYILYAILALCLFGIFFMNSPGKNPLINFGAGLWTGFNTATGLLGDLLSYVRLFAIGLTGGMLGGAFNKMAVMLSPDIPVVGFLVSFLILIFGHSLNFGLSMLSSLIHPIRLTFVEFFKNSGYEGGGKKYEPLKYNQPK